MPKALLTQMLRADIEFYRKSGHCGLCNLLFDGIGRMMVTLCPYIVRREKAAILRSHLESDRKADSQGFWALLANCSTNSLTWVPTSSPQHPAALAQEPANNTVSHQSAPIPDTLRPARSSKMAPQTCRSNGNALLFEALPSV